MRVRSGILAAGLLLLAAAPAHAQTRIVIDRPPPPPPPKATGIDLEAKQVEERPSPPPQAVVRNFVPDPVFDHVLEQQIRAIANAYRARVALYAWQLNTSKAAAVDADQPILTPAATRLALFWETLRQIALGNATWDERTGGPGTPTLQDSAFRLVTSDDPAPATALAARFTSHRVDEDMTFLGYTGSVQPASIARAQRGGSRTAPSAGVTASPAATPRQITGLMQHIGMCDLDLPRQLHINLIRGEAACRVASGMLRTTFYRTTLDVPARTSSSALRSDVAILGGKAGPIVLSVMVYNTPSPREADTALASITRAVVNAWSPAGLDAHSFDRPHLGVDWQ